MDKKTVDAIQLAFKKAVEAFNSALVSALGEKNANSVIITEAPKHRGRPRKEKPIVASLGLSTGKRRGRPPKNKVAQSPLVIASAPKHRGRPRKSK